MTIELFRADPYCSVFDAQVRSIGPNFVVLDETYFFPGCADQPSDRGWIESIEVLDVVRDGEEIRHVVSETSSSTVAVGDIVSCEIDWERRFRTMRLHTAQHLLGLAVRATLDPELEFSATADDRWARISLPPETAATVDVDAIQQWIDTAVLAAHLTVHEADQSLERNHHWHIDGLATIPCHGTHVRTTAEIGAVDIELSSPTSGSIELRAGLRVT